MKRQRGGANTANNERGPASVTLLSFNKEYQQHNLPLAESEGAEANNLFFMFAHMWSEPFEASPLLKCRRPTNHFEVCITPHQSMLFVSAPATKACFFFLVCPWQHSGVRTEAETHLKTSINNTLLQERKWREKKGERECERAMESHHFSNPSGTDIATSPLSQQPQKK